MKKTQKKKAPKKKAPKLPKALKPYFRKVIAHPEGAVVHYGDCSIYNEPRICDCGLLRTLLAIEKPEQWYEKYDEEIIVPLDGVEGN